MSIFGNFYDESKTREENQAQFEKARQNKEVMQQLQVGVAIVVGVIGGVFTVKKLMDTFNN